MAEHASLIIRASCAFAAVLSRNHVVRRSPVIPVLLAAPSTVARSDNQEPAHQAPDDDSNDDSQQPPHVHDDLKLLETQSRNILGTVFQQLTFGGTLGFATGYAVTVLSKPLMFFIGTEVLVLQYFAYRDWISVHWGKIASDVKPKFSGPTSEGLLDILVYKMPFGASFTGGFVAGLRLNQF